MDPLTLTIQIKNVYGVPRAYPACDRSRIFCDMLGSKTLTRRDLGMLQAVGFIIETTGDYTLGDVK